MGDFSDFGGDYGDFGGDFSDFGDFGDFGDDFGKKSHPAKRRNCNCKAVLRHLCQMNRFNNKTNSQAILLYGL